jgi:hypothetical protein
VLVPGLPNTLPAVGVDNGLSALRVRTGGSTTAQSNDPNLGGPAGDSFADPSVENLFTSDYHDTLHVMKSASATSGPVHAVATAVGNAAFGELRASAFASNTKGGFYDARASVVVEFIDEIQIKPGSDNFNFSATWAVDGQVTGAADGRGFPYILAQGWVFPFGPFPPQFASFDAQEYVGTFRQFGMADQVTELGDMKNLDVRASGAFCVQSIGRFFV